MHIIGVTWKGFLYARALSLNHGTRNEVNSI